MIKDGATHDRIDVVLLNRTLEWITRHPEAHEQGEWLHRDETDEPTLTCGTSGCLAGWACVFGGYEPYFVTDRALGGTHYVRATTAASPLPASVEPNRRVNDDLRPFALLNDVLLVGEAARRLLGLSATEADLLFEAGNSRYDLWRLAELFTGGVIVRPAEVGPDPDVLVDFWSEAEYATFGDDWGTLPNGEPVNELAVQLADVQLG